MAGTKTEIVALRPFPYSNNGVVLEHADLGDIVAIDAALVSGLVSEGFAKIFDGGSLPAKPAAEVIAAAQSATPDIPADWRSMHHLKIIALAKSLGADISTKADAIAAIEAAEKA